MSGDQVVVGYVHSNDVAISFHHSVIKLWQHSLTTDRPLLAGWIPMRYGTGGLVEARNRVAATFLEATDADWLLSLDTDMGFDGDMIDRLVDAADPVERPVVGALCFINSETGSDGMGGVRTVPKPSIFFWGTTPDGPNGEKGGTGFLPMLQYPPDTLVTCSGTGAAAILIHRSVLERIGEKWGHNYYGQIANPEGGIAFSEDFSFCIRCAEFGIPIHVHTGIKTSHMKTIFLAEEHNDLYISARSTAA